jgi:hypothetical protein
MGSYARYVKSSLRRPYLGRAQKLWQDMDPTSRHIDKFAMRLTKFEEELVPYGQAHLFDTSMSHGLPTEQLSGPDLSQAMRNEYSHKL